MAVRATDAGVKEIIEVEATISTTPFIAVANNLINRTCGAAGTTLSEADLTLIETWLAAHFYAIRESRTSSESADGVSDTFQSKVDLGLKLTHYGQMALVLDTTGKLLNSGTRRPSMTWAGTVPT